MKMSPNVEVEMLVPRGVPTQDFVDILFKSKKVAEAADFEHVEDEDGPGAAKARITRAARRSDA
ncbi:MAG: hypothetical protein SGPRY_012805 [Prymnesium sp.]